MAGVLPAEPGRGEALLGAYVVGLWATLLLPCSPWLIEHSPVRPWELDSGFTPDP